MAQSFGQKQTKIIIGQIEFQAEDVLSEVSKGEAIYPGSKWKTYQPGSIQTSLIIPLGHSRSNLQK